MADKSCHHAVQFHAKCVNSYSWCSRKLGCPGLLTWNLATEASSLSRRSGQVVSGASTSFQGRMARTSGSWDDARGELPPTQRLFSGQQETGCLS